MSEKATSKEYEIFQVWQSEKKWMLTIYKIQSAILLLYVDLFNLFFKS